MLWQGDANIIDLDGFDDANLRQEKQRLFPQETTLEINPSPLKRRHQADDDVTPAVTTYIDYRSHKRQHLDDVTPKSTTSELLEPTPDPKSSGLDDHSLNNSEITEWLDLRAVSPFLGEIDPLLSLILD